MPERRLEPSDLLRSFRWVYDILDRAEIGEDEYTTEDRYIDEGAGAGQIEELFVRFDAPGVGELPLYHRRKGGVLLQRDSSGEKRVWDKIAAIRRRRGAPDEAVSPAAGEPTDERPTSGPARLEPVDSKPLEPAAGPHPASRFESPRDRGETGEEPTAEARTLSWPGRDSRPGPPAAVPIDPLDDDEMLPLTVKLPAELIERLNTAAFWLRGESLASLTEAALEDHLRTLESVRSERILTEIRKRLDGESEARQERITRALLLALARIVRLTEIGLERLPRAEREELRRRAQGCLAMGVRYWPQAAARALDRGRE